MQLSSFTAPLTGPFTSFCFPLARHRWELNPSAQQWRAGVVAWLHTFAAVLIHNVLCPALALHACLSAFVHDCIHSSTYSCVCPLWPATGGKRPGAIHGLPKRRCAPVRLESPPPVVQSRLFVVLREGCVPSSSPVFISRPPARFILFRKVGARQPSRGPPSLSVLSRGYSMCALARQRRGSPFPLVSHPRSYPWSSEKKVRAGQAGEPPPHLYISREACSVTLSPHYF